MNILEELKKLSPAELIQFERIKQIIGGGGQNGQNPELPHQRLSMKNPDGTYSRLPDELHVPSKQGRFTQAEINERLKKFMEISPRMLEKIPYGTWIRYYSHQPDGSVKFCVGGFLIKKGYDEKTHDFQYVTLKCIHYPGTPNSKVITWCVQVKNFYKIFAQGRAVIRYKQHKKDQEYGLLKGTYAFYKKWFTKHNKSGKFVVYDKINHKLFYAEKGTALLRKLDKGIKVADLKKQLKIENQLENPLKGKYIVTRKVSDLEIKQIRVGKNNIKKKKSA